MSQIQIGDETYDCRKILARVSLVAVVAILIMLGLFMYAEWDRRKLRIALRAQEYHNAGLLTLITNLQGEIKVLKNAFAAQGRDMWYVCRSDLPDYTGCASAEPDGVGQRVYFEWPLAYNGRKSVSERINHYGGRPVTFTAPKGNIEETHRMSFGGLLVVNVEIPTNRP